MSKGKIKVISEDEAKLAASIMATWCANQEDCSSCFLKDCNSPASWLVPFIHESKFEVIVYDCGMNVQKKEVVCADNSLSAVALVLNDDVGVVEKYRDVESYLDELLESGLMVSVEKVVE